MLLKNEFGITNHNYITSLIGAQHRDASIKLNSGFGRPFPIQAIIIHASKRLKRWQLKKKKKKSQLLVKILERYTLEMKKHESNKSLN